MKPADEEKPATGLSLGMGIWVTACAVIGGIAGGYFGLQINFIAAYIGVMLGAAFGAIFAFAPSI